MPDLTVKLVLEGLTKDEADLLYLMASDKLGRPLEAKMFVEVFRTTPEPVVSFKPCSRSNRHLAHFWGANNKWSCPGVAEDKSEEEKSHVTETNPDGGILQCNRRDIHGPHEWQAEFVVYFNVYCPGNDGSDSNV